MSVCCWRMLSSGRIFTSLGSANLPELRGSFSLRRGEKGACVLQSAAKGHLADLAVRAVAVHFALVVWQHLRHCGNRGKKGNRTEKIRFSAFWRLLLRGAPLWSWTEQCVKSELCAGRSLCDAECADVDAGYAESCARLCCWLMSGEGSGRSRDHKGNPGGTVKSSIRVWGAEREWRDSDWERSRRDTYRRERK